MRLRLAQQEGDENDRPENGIGILTRPALDPIPRHDPHHDISGEGQSESSVKLAEGESALGQGIQQATTERYEDNGANEVQSKMSQRFEQLPAKGPNAKRRQTGRREPPCTVENSGSGGGWMGISAQELKASGFEGIIADSGKCSSSEGGHPSSSSASRC